MRLFEIAFEKGLYQSRRNGETLVGLAPQTKLQVPHIEI